MADPSSRNVPISVDLSLGEARLTLQAQVPRAPLRTVRLLPLLRQVDDVLIADTAQRAGTRGDQVSCAVGCAACCHYLVPIPAVDARRIADLVASFPAEVQEVVRRRFADAADRLAEAGLLERLRAPELLSAEELQIIGDAYFALGVPCPFLEDSRCAIYRERPLTCREFFVVSPPALCSAPPGAPVRALKLPARPSVAAAALEPGPAFFEGGWVPLVLALEWAAQHPEPEPPPAAELAERFFAALSADAQTP